MIATLKSWTYRKGQIMNLSIFLVLFIIMSAISSLLTEAVKMMFKESGVKCSLNLLALIDAVVVGGMFTTGAYVFLEIPFTLPNILALLAMMVAIWIGSMIGYDKVIQLISQIKVRK